MKRFLPLHLMLFLLLFLASFIMSAAAQRPMQTSDIHALRDIADPQISPDGAHIVCTITETLPDRRTTATRLWIFPTRGGSPRRLTNDDATESNPRWSPDGRQIAFYSTRGGTLALWTLDVDQSGSAAGEPRRVARIARTNFYLKSAGESFAWAPDGKRIAFLTSPESVPGASLAAPGNQAMAGIPERLRRPLTRAEIDQLPPEVRTMILRAQGLPTDQPATSAPPAIASAPAATASAPSPSDDDPRVITRLQYKSRTSFSDSLKSHIFIADISSGAIKQLTATRFYEHSINFSPRGDEIVFVSNREPDPDKVNNTDIFTVNSNTGEVRQLTRTKGCEWMPVFSPDGSEIAYLATTRAITTIDSVAEDTQVFVIPARGGEARAISRSLDRRAFSVKWASDGRNLFFTASDRGRTLLYRAAREGGIAPVFERDVQIAAFTAARNGDLALTLSSTTRPTELHLISAGGEIKTVSTINREAVSEWTLAEPRRFVFMNEELEIEAWLYPPSGLNPDRKYPLILSIHGGPHGMYGYGFNPAVQSLAARGYAVLLVNPRGSSGYGQKFSDGCVNDWGGGDYRDLMKGVDQALARFPFLDPSRLGVTGGSYGGYMTNWVVTQTNRFRAGAAMASLSNLISFYSTSLYQDLIHAEFNGEPWDNYNLLWERSPLAHIKKAQTPLLLIHGEADNDVHITQAEEMFTALRMRGVESVFVRYPREGHGFREPRHREDQLARTIAWFDKYLQPGK